MKSGGKRNTRNMVLAVAVAGCATVLLGNYDPPDGGPTYGPAIPAYDEVGYASWYGHELAGRRTANGEMFEPDGISGAHRTLPLPSYVEVTSLDTGRTLLVRLNDRGPVSRKRIIDLSWGAARQLGIDQRGIAQVRVRRVIPTDFELSTLGY